MGIEKKVQNADVPEANANQDYGVMDRLREGIKGSKAYKGLVGVLSGLALAYAVNMTDFSNGRVMNTASAEQAEASVCQDEVPIDQYWEAAKPVNNPEYPEGTRVRSYKNDNLCAEGTITPALDGQLNGGHWSVNEDFKNVYFNSKHSEKLKDVFRSHGVNLQKFENLLQDCSDYIGVGVYNRGNIAILDNASKDCYIVKTDKGISTEVGKKVYGAK